MDWADDISFATTDIEDYYCAGLIPLDSLKRDIPAIAAHGVARLGPDHHDFDPDDFRCALDQVVKGAANIDRPYQDTREDRCRLNAFVSGYIGKLIEAVKVIDDPPFIEIEANAQYLVEALKELNWYYVIDSPALAAAQIGQRKLIEGLFEALVAHLRDETETTNRRRIPIGLMDIYRSIAEGRNANRALKTHQDSRCARAVCDYICSLTENQVIDLYERVSGVTRNSFLGSWVST
jgi:dGTPase